MTSIHKPCGEMDIDTDISFGSQLRFTCMYAYPYTDSYPLSP